MRNHILPQEYLQHFCQTTSGRDVICTYSKTDAKWLPKTTPLNTAVRKNFYYDEDETGLSQEIEGPAIEPLNKLRDGTDLSEPERVKVANYIYAMLVRTPQARRAKENLMVDAAPKAATDAIKKFEVSLRARRKYLTEDAKRYVDEFIESSQNDPKNMPDGLWEQGINTVWYKPYNDEEYLEGVQILSKLSWRVIFAGSAHQFITSDNPVHMIDEIDLPLFELTMPLSSQCALHISRQGKPGQLEFLVDKRRANKINIRTATNADRFIYAAREERWVRKCVSQSKPLRRNLRFIWHNAPLIREHFLTPVCSHCESPFTLAEMESGTTEYSERDVVGDVVSMIETTTILHSCLIKGGQISCTIEKVIEDKWEMPP